MAAVPVPGEVSIVYSTSLLYPEDQKSFRRGTILIGGASGQQEKTLGDPSQPYRQENHNPLRLSKIMKSNVLKFRKPEE